MRSEMVMPAAIAAEKRISWKTGLFLTAAVLALIYIPWLGSQCELFRQEGLFASCASEYTPGLKVTAHSVVQRNVWPLYPAVVSVLYRFGIPMESALRIVSVFCIAVWSLLAGYAASTRRNGRAGVVTICCCMGTFFAMEKGIIGGCESMTAMFLLGAQLIFFHYGSRHANWTSAWIRSSVLVALAFLSGGFLALLCFVFPMFFFRRPLSLSSKFNTPGFIIGLAIVALAVFAWAIPTGLAVRHYDYGIVSGDFSTWHNLRRVLLFPLEFPFRMLPWSLLIWMPFCVALQAIDSTPIFSRYLRTLFFSTFLLIWLLPGRAAAELFYAIGPLAILTGLNYDLGVRRYGRSLRILLICGELLFIAGALTVVGFCLLPDDLVGYFGDIHRMGFRSGDTYSVHALISAVALITLGTIFHFGRKKLPLWLLILLLLCGSGIFYTLVMRPYRAANREWRTLGRDIASALPADENIGRIYKYDIDGMFCGLYYVGKPVTKLHSPEDLAPDEKVVYIISSVFPNHQGRKWRSLLPPNYRCQGKPVSLWRGELRQSTESELSNEL